MSKKYQVNVRDTESGKTRIVEVTGKDAGEVAGKLERMSRGGDVEVLGGAEILPEVPEPLENGEY